MGIERVNQFINDLDSYSYEEFVQFYLSHGRDEITSRFHITKKDLTSILKYYGLKKDSGHWYNNGNEEIFISSGAIVPEGYVSGRLNLNNWNTKDTFWITNGKTDRLLRNDESIPQGFHRGKSCGSTSGYRTYNDGTSNFVLSPDSSIPENLKQGRAKTTNIGYERSAQKRKVKIYNNGVDEIKIHNDDVIPEGYVEGKLKNRRKLKIDARDEEYRRKGYIPLKEVIEMFGKSGYDHLKNELNIIELPDPYVYVSIGDLDKLKKYSEENHSFGTSLIEKEVVAFIRKNYKGKIKTNCKSVLKGDDGKIYELDVYVPDKNIAIEIDGNYWHSSEYVDKNYHLNKTKLCEKLGIRLIHIFEYNWREHEEICKSIILSALDIYENTLYARNCKVIENIDNDVLKEFLNKNHIQGYIPSTYNIALSYDGEIVEVLTFRKSRFKQNEIELARMCTKLNTQVIGGFSKLLKHQKYDIFNSYVDRSIFNGKSYLKNGFTLIGETPPSYKYYKSGKVYNRIRFQKHKLNKLLSNFDVNQTEIENMKNNGYLLIYDCGTLKVRYIR